MGQTRQRPSNKAERRKAAADASDAPVVHCKSSEAGTRAVEIDELAKLIFFHSPEGVVLSKFQCVCRRWRTLAREVLQPFLEGVPAASSQVKDERRQMNPLLKEHFGRIFNDGQMRLDIGLWLTGQHISRMRSLIDLPMATSGPGRVVHSAYARAGASWRDMQIYHPPIYVLRYRRAGESSFQAVAVQDGVRFGHVYDIIVAVASNTKGFSWNEVLLTWPLARSDDGVESSSGSSSGYDSDSDDDDDEAVDRNCIHLVRVQHDLPKFCDCARTPSANERCFCGFGGNKHKLQLIASNKWRVTSKDYDEDELMVDI